MRKFLISLATAASALAFAAPAAAQYYPAPMPQPYGYGYGFQNNYGQVRALQARVDHVERMINRLDRRDVIRERTADRLRNEANGIEYRLRRSARYGLNPYEANDIHARIARLEQRVQWAMYDRRGRNGRHDGGWGYNDRDRDYSRDRDHDGRDDRWERERRDRDDD
jgi:hypothetical protein